MRRLVQMCLLALVGLSVFASAGWAAPPSASQPGKLDVTFLVTADLHFGSRTGMTTTQRDDPDLPIEAVHRIIVDQMNRIEGVAFPREIGGTVGRPRGLLAAGDLTESAQEGQWKDFVSIYGLVGGDGLLAWPVYECLGNHDRGRGEKIAQAVARRHKAVHYAWDWDRLHVVCLGEPTDADMAFLTKDLAAVEAGRPIVIYFHYAIVGPYSDNYWFGQGDHRDRFAKTLAGHNVIALFHGHFHGSGYYPWKGYDVYDVGAAKHGSKDFAVVHVTDDRLTVSAWNYEGKPGWWWAHAKPLGSKARRGGADEVLKVYPHAGAHARPCIPHPLTDGTR